MHIFISYSKQDIQFARYLKRALEEAGFVVWMDETEMRPSTRWWPTIERNIETSAAVVVIMSPNSRESDWVEREILYAERLIKPIFPVLLAGEDWPRLANIQYSDMTRGVGADLPYSLLDGLNAVILPSKSGSLDAAPEDLPGPLIPESRAPAARGRRAWLTTVFVILMLAAAAVVIVMLQSGDDEPPATEDVAAREIALAETQSALLNTQAALTPSVMPTGAASDAPEPSNTPPPSPTPTDPAEPSATPADPPTSTATPELDPALAAALALGLDPNAALIPELSDNRAWQPQRSTLADVPVVYVPGGCFLMGLDAGEPDEKPAHRACLSPFWITTTEVTNAQYRLCVNAGACTAPQDVEYFNNRLYLNYPVVFVTWEQANAYATWLGGALPTEAQWEYVARGPSGWNYPWSNFLPDCDLAVLENCADGLTVVGVDERPNGHSWVGAADVAGSVWEWIADWYNQQTYTATDAGLDPTGPASGDVHVIRGGAWDSPVEVARGSYRNYRSDPAYAGNDVGFRVVFPVRASE